MKTDNSNFTSLDKLISFIKSTKDGSLSIIHQNLENYEGMVFYIGIRFNVAKNDYQLNLEWMCLGLDLFGDNLVESYVYQFNKLELLLEYLDKKYQIKITDIKTNYMFDDALFPNPIKNKDKENLYKNKWEQFQNDFKSGNFLDSTLQLVYSSLE